MIELLVGVVQRGVQSLERGIRSDEPWARTIRERWGLMPSGPIMPAHRVEQLRRYLPADGSGTDGDRT